MRKKKNRLLYNVLFEAKRLEAKLKNNDTFESFDINNERILYR